ncbi:MAG: cation transporter [Hyphomicrobiales bacterium]|nr:MAG: cation transporter [Hyphomicrobiales bacterium]
MHTHSLQHWQHGHGFLGRQHDENEYRTWLVVGLTAVTMVAEIVGGSLFGSMALVADGWHMATHAGALAIAALAYRFARRFAEDERFVFGTGKLGDLAGYTSALILAMVALLIGYESVQRLLQPVAISFDAAIAIAGVGLAVNVLSAWLLRETHEHAEHTHAPDRHHHHHHRDHNLSAAYLHVLADALTSILAIVALLAGRFYGWVWLDPVMGLVGAVVIAIWSIGLLRTSAGVLLDTVPDVALKARVQQALEEGSDRVSDLHLWRLAPGHFGVVAAIVADAPQAPEVYKQRLAGLPGLSHVTVEVHACRHD